MADAAAAPAPAVDLMTSILPAGGVDANALDAAFTLVSEESLPFAPFFSKEAERGQKDGEKG